jgi:hypothetical protein
MLEVVENKSEGRRKSLERRGEERKKDDSIRLWDVRSKGFIKPLEIRQNDY